MKTKIPAVKGKTIGLGLGDRRHAVCVLDDSGEILAEETIANSREVLTAFRASRQEPTTKNRRRFHGAGGFSPNL